MSPEMLSHIKSKTTQVWFEKEKRADQTLYIPSELQKLGYKPPKLYIAYEVWSVLNQSEAECPVGSPSLTERSLLFMLHKNVTNSIVKRPEDADWIFIPYLSQIDCGHDVMNSYPRFQHAFDAVRHLGRRFIVYTARPWNARTMVHLETEEMLKRFKSLVVWSPEVRTINKWSLGTHEMWLARHVVVPQPPLEFEINDPAFKPSWQRKFEFCFQGTQINYQRIVTAKVLANRNDSFVYAGCRRQRKSMAASQLASASSRSLYSQCEFCIMPMGDSLSDKRLFDAMMSGCIPIIYEQLKPLPFAQFLDYRKFSLHLSSTFWKSDISGALDKIQTLSREKRSAMRHALLYAAHSISFSSSDGYSGLHYALALTSFSTVSNPIEKVHTSDDFHRTADLQGWWGIKKSKE